MTSAGLLSAIALGIAAMFGWAAVSKLGDREGTHQTMRGFNLPAPGFFTLAVPALELVIAVLLVVTPSLGALAAVTLLVFFTTFLLLQLRLGVRTPCRCFGSTTAHPLAVADVARNLALIVLTMPVVTLLSLRTPEPAALAVVLVGAVVGARLLSRLRSETATEPR